MSKKNLKEFRKSDLRDMAYEANGEDFEVVSCVLVDQSRWSVFFDMIFKHEGSYYKTSYSKGATEYQDESPYEYDSEFVACQQVIPKEVIKIEYVAMQ